MLGRSRWCNRVNDQFIKTFGKKYVVLFEFQYLGNLLVWRQGLYPFGPGLRYVGRVTDFISPFVPGASQ